MTTFSVMFSKYMDYVGEGINILCIIIITTMSLPFALLGYISTKLRGKR